MNELIITSENLHVIRSELLCHSVENCAILYASVVKRRNGYIRFIIKEVEIPSPDDYSDQRLDHAELNPGFVARVSSKARNEKLSLIFTHTHPGGIPPSFSQTDDDGELILARFLSYRIPSSIHGAMVVSKGGINARILGTKEFIRVISVGEHRTVEFDPDITRLEDLTAFDRQIRAFGASGQHVLNGLRIGIVGLGGTGSIMAQQLVHMGIRNFILIDPDTIEETNLNRVVGSTPSDIGLYKVDISKRYIKSFSNNANVECVPGDVIYSSVAKNLVEADIIFSCTDSHGSRSIIQQVAYQYLIPCIDVGSTITTHEGRVTGIFGRIQLLSPGEPCLWCSNLLSSEEVRRDTMNEFERKADPYIQGIYEPAPSVISLNATVVSLAMTMLLGLVTPLPIPHRYLIYNAVNSTLRPVRSTAKENCFICSSRGVLAKGDILPLFARQD